ncbi:ATP/GTP-binding protein [Actinacidiphila sp. ITFR-21]|uniref:ATP/GTP-binding protein n=1 Tax=Actinacidiphila sp. ITFR-21 TaxID=3075199 RepID=UPI00288B58DA|nr:ATP-binding protein [Streptomyces sp. ITFR-21]WNI15073.1 ATP-binding protein [Streptomyces sp. ITFR-21]
MTTEQKQQHATPAPAADPARGRIRLAVSGTYGVGKTTTAEALSIATGIPRTHALTSREILADLIPGKTVQELSADELILLGLRRLEERVHNEAAVPSFISDGSVVHEWVYGEARMRVGVNPGADAVVRGVKAVAGLPVKRFYQRYMDAYGVVVKQRAKRLYDAYVHLPVEFDMVDDGHRPVSERFRRLSDDLLVEALEELGIPYHVVGGTVEERLRRVLEIHRLPVVVPVADAVEQAVERVGAATAVLDAHARRMAAERDRSLRRRIRYALRY